MLGEAMAMPGIVQAMPGAHRNVTSGRELMADIPTSDQLPWNDRNVPTSDQLGMCVTTGDMMKTPCDWLVGM